MFAEVLYQKVLISFLIDCGSFCTCCLSHCSLGPIKLLPEAPLELLQGRVFSTQLDWRHSSEGLSSVGSLFQSILKRNFSPCLFFGGCYCCLVLQGVHEGAVKVKIKLFALFLLSACLAVFQVDLVPLLHYLILTGCFESGQLQPPGLFILRGSGHGLL